MENTYKVNKKAVEKIIERVYDNGSTVINKNDLEEMFPELKKESEDEKIRKALIRCFSGFEKDSSTWGGFKRKDILSWLEKQCEFKNIDSDDLATLEIWEDAIKENKEKWQLSDWFVESTSLLIQKVKRIENNESINIKGSRAMLNACVNVLRNVGHSHLSDWLKKQGEQKSLDDIAKEFTKDKDTAISFLKSCGIINENGELADEYKIEQGEQKPQRKTSAEAKEAMYDKPAWSEEDKYLCMQIEGILQECWVKNLVHLDLYKKMRNFIKSLKERYTWKPSEEQMEALHTYIYNPQYFNSPDPRMELVESVYNDLKKLKG